MRRSRLAVHHSSGARRRNECRGPGVSSSSSSCPAAWLTCALPFPRVVSQMSMPMSGGHAASPNGAAVRHTPLPLRRLSTRSMCRRRSPAPSLEGPAAPLAPAECARPTPDPRAGARRVRPVLTDRCALLCRQATPARQYSWLSRRRRRAALCGPPRDRRSPASLGAVARAIRTQAQPSGGAPAGSQQEPRQSPPPAARQLRPQEF